MTDILTRRRLLQAGATVATGHAGCLGSRDDDPDAGTDSYGLRIINRTQERHTATIRVSTMDDNESVFEERVELEREDSQSWDTVLVQDVQHQVTAWIDSENQPRSCDFSNVNCGKKYVNVGGPDAPSVADLRIVIRYGTIPGTTRTTTMLEFRFADR